MHRAVDEHRDGRVWPLVHEIGPGVGAGDGDLCLVGQPVAVVLQPLDEPRLQVAVGLGDQRRGLLGPGLPAPGRQRDAARDREQQVPGAVPVDQLVDQLVAVAEQAVVAGLAAGVPWVSAAVVGAGVRIEVGDPERLPGRPGERVLLGLQAAQHAGPALGGLGEQHPVPRAVFGGQQLAVQLGVLQLEHRLDAAFQREHHRARHLFGRRLGELEDQDVAAVLDERDDAGAPIGGPIVVIRASRLWRRVVLRLTTCR